MRLATMPLTGSGRWNAREDSKSLHIGIQVIAESRVEKSVLGKEGGDREGLLVHRKKHGPVRKL